MRDRVLGSKVLATLTLSAWLIQSAWVLPRASAQDDGTKAQDQDARQLFEAGRNAYDEGRYKEALARFQAAYALSGRPALLFNIGQAADRLRNDELALQSFEQFVAAVPEAQNRAAVEERIALLREVLDAKKQQTAAPIATPAEAAQTAEPAPAPVAIEVLQAPEQSPSDDDGLLSQWWFWAAAGGVVAGVVVVASVVAGGGEAEQGAPTLGSDDRVVVALRY